MYPANNCVTRFIAIFAALQSPGAEPTLSPRFTGIDINFISLLVEVPGFQLKESDKNMCNG